MRQFEYSYQRGFYEVFPPEQARKLVEKIEFHYTPKHGSWLNVAENELSSMTQQCLKDRKMTNIDMLKNETSAWATNSNEKQKGVNWQFKVEDAYNGGAYYNWVAVQPDEPEGEFPRSATRPLNGILYVHRQGDPDYARADQYRWRIADCVPFSQSLEVNIENRYAITGSKWTSVAFWYQYHCVKADFDDDCDVDFFDYAVFASHWLDDCLSPDFCDGADLDTSQKVDANDLNILIQDWL